METELEEHLGVTSESSPPPARPGLLLGLWLSPPLTALPCFAIGLRHSLQQGGQDGQPGLTCPGSVPLLERATLLLFPIRGEAPSSISAGPGVGQPLHASPLALGVRYGTRDWPTYSPLGSPS